MRIYEWMLHYRKIAVSERFRITRWKLTSEQACRFAMECEPTMAVKQLDLVLRLKAGREVILGIPAVVR